MRPALLPRAPAGHRGPLHTRSGPASSGARAPCPVPLPSLTGSCRAPACGAQARQAGVPSCGHCRSTPWGCGPTAGQRGPSRHGAATPMAGRPRGRSWSSQEGVPQGRAALSAVTAGGAANPKPSKATPTSTVTAGQEGDRQSCRGGEGTWGRGDGRRWWRGRKGTT